MKTLVSFITWFLLIYTPSWTQCISGDCKDGKGIYAWESGARYEGEWRGGMKHGQGTYYFANGDKYVGAWENDDQTGKAIFYLSSGARYEGNFVKGEKVGKGTYYFSNGDRYEGNYTNDTEQGKGTHYFYSGDRYEGDFLDGQFHGQGIYFFANGNRYEGNFIQGKFEGEGKQYFAKGGILIGIWKDGEYISAGNSNDKQTRDERALNIDVIAMTKDESGIYEIPIMINGALRLHFIIDTGASELILSPDVALTLIRTKTVTEDDFLEGKEFILADGTTMQSSRFNIREIMIGNHKIRNVAAAISNSIEAPILLGQNVLSKLGKIQIDYTQGTFTIID